MFGYTKMNGEVENMNKRQLFVFFQFNGTNKSFCNQACPYCYGKDGKTFKHYWNENIDGWEKAFERLNRDIYFVMSYGEAMGSHGFYECVDMIGKHPTWTLNIITNLSYSPERLIASRLGKEKRVFITACWHPLGVEDKNKGWENFKKNLLLLKKAEIPVHVMMVWYKPQIKLFPEYFEWFDNHDFRVGVRRFVHPTTPKIQKLLRRYLPKYFAGKYALEKYTEAERDYIYAYTCPEVTKYGLDLVSTFGVTCSAGKDMILVEHDGTIKLCASCTGPNHKLGNLFDTNFKLNSGMIKCPTNNCGGDFGMLHLIDEEFGALPERLWNDTFISQVENLPQSSPVAYHKRKEMLECLERIKNER